MADRETEAQDAATTRDGGSLGRDLSAVGASASQGEGHGGGSTSVSEVPETKILGAEADGALPDGDDLAAEAELYSGALALRGERDTPGELILSMVRAARSFITYDARNVTVRRLLAAYREVSRRALEKHGTITYVVGAFDISSNNEVVYQEKDRERSVAFRLFRDGVRGFTIKPEVSWEDLLKLLEVLSVRYRGIRQQEDDTLTLLRQANFEHVAFDVVEAYVPSEEEPEEAAEQQHFADKAMPPADWDQPAPQLGSPRGVVFKTLGEAEKSALRDEYGTRALIGGAVQVANEMLDLAKSSGDEEIEENVLMLIEEICKYLVVELRPAELVKVVRKAQTVFPEHPETAKLAEDFGSGDILDRFLRDPDDVTADALMPLFMMIDSDHLERVVDRFVEEPEPRVRRGLMKILSRLAMGKPDALLNKLGDVPTDRMVDLFNVVCVVAPPERALEAAYSKSEHESAEVQLGALEVIALDSYGERFHHTINRLLNSDPSRVRVKATVVFGKKCGRRGFPLLREQTEQLIKDNKLDEIEAAVLGTAMMRSARELAIPLLRSWVRPRGIRGMFKKVSLGGSATRMLRWAAVSGLGDDPSEQTRSLLTWLKSKADTELAARCEETLASFPSPDVAAKEAAAKEAAAKEAPAKEAVSQASRPRGVRRGSARKDEVEL